MLDEEVVEAVRNGQFHIWAIGHIADGLEILTGFHAGYERNNNGEFPEGSIFARADERFSKMHEIAKEEREQLKE